MTNGPVKMGPERPLPYNTDAFSSTEDYIQSLLDLVGGNDFFRTLCGGVHILDFFTSDPPLYDRLLPLEWRNFFAQHSITNLLYLYLREDLNTLFDDRLEQDKWRDGPFPPSSLIQYVRLVRKHFLDRELQTSQCTLNRTQKKLAPNVALGMNIKKVHEVGLFASYIDSLAKDLSSTLPSDQALSHFVDFGSGQGYLGRALASEPYNRNIVAIESKASNADRARQLDVKAELLKKHHILRNKKAYRAGLLRPDIQASQGSLPTPPPELTDTPVPVAQNQLVKPDIERPSGSKGTVQHVSHYITSGDLTDVISNIHDPPPRNVVVMSLHSCGNLVHHGLRSLTANPRVKAVAMVGCCYNLITERLGPATYKLPNLRPTTHDHTRLSKEGDACDPAGFPMSQRFCQYGSEGLRLNITARMMAVQAPKNWGLQESQGFFTRHFYRALLQRIFLDRGVVQRPNSNVGDHHATNASSSGGTPIILGSLKKSCYDSFPNYVRGALEKLYENEIWAAATKEKVGNITNDEIVAYETSYKERQKDLSIVWSLMAFSAGAVEAAIVVDRWLWLKEQEEVKEAWVETVFDYRLSPRNLVVVGVK